MGCDRQITAHPFCEKDLFCDMQARVNYSSPHRKRTLNTQALPSIATRMGENVVTWRNATLKCGLRRGLGMFERQTNFSNLPADEDDESVILNSL